MAADMKIYIHGRPQGQDIWCSGEYSSDRVYIEPFLDSKIGADVDAVMTIDTWQENTYYTYIRRKNVIEKERAQGYFAITLRLTKSVCRNVSSLYKLLDLIYCEKCLGSILKKNNGTEHYVIGKFSEVETLLKEIESLIIANFTKVLESSVESLTSNSNTLDSYPIKYSIMDVDSPTFVSDAANRKIAVSKGYPTQVEVLKNQVDVLSHEKSELESRLSNARASTKAEYQKELDAKDKETKRVEAQIRSITTERDNALNKCQKLEKEKTEIDQYKELLDYFLEAKDSLIKFARLTASRFPDGSGGNHNDVQTGNKARTSKVWLLWLNTAILFTLLGFVVWFIIYNPTSKKEVVETDTTKIEWKKKYEALRDSISRIPSHSTATPNTEVTKKAEPTTYTINIRGFDGTGNLKVGTSYTLNIKGIEKECQWSVEGNASITENQLLINAPGNVTIRGHADGLTIQSRVITATTQ